MALPVATPFADGALTGTLYAFADAGDQLPMHDHDADTAHITILTAGSFEISGPGWSRVIGPGACPIQSFSPGQPHQVTALQAGSRIVNIVKGSK